jgi:hypothetical protein
VEVSSIFPSFCVEESEFVPEGRDFAGIPLSRLRPFTPYGELSTRLMISLAKGSYKDG